MTNKVSVGIWLFIIIVVIGGVIFRLNSPAVTVERAPFLIYSGSVVDGDGNELLPAIPFPVSESSEAKVATMKTPPAPFGILMDFLFHARVCVLPRKAFPAVVSHGLISKVGPRFTLSEMGIDVTVTFVRDTHSNRPPEILVMLPTYPTPENPILALREYLEKQGHWSARWIPDFPLEDLEAQRLARNVLIERLYKDAGNTILTGRADTACWEIDETFEIYKNTVYQRRYDLARLWWGSYRYDPEAIKVENPERFLTLGADPEDTEKLKDLERMGYNINPFYR